VLLQSGVNFSRRRRTVQFAALKDKPLHPRNCLATHTHTEGAAAEPGNISTHSTTALYHDTQAGHQGTESLAAVQTTFGITAGLDELTVHQSLSHHYSGAAVRASDFRSSSRVFDSRPGHNQGT